MSLINKCAEKRIEESGEIIEIKDANKFKENTNLVNIENFTRTLTKYNNAEITSKSCRNNG